MNEERRIVILFSSGFDSTLLLADAIKNSSPDVIVSAVAIDNSLTIKHQLEREHENQLLILRTLRKSFPDRRIEYQRIKIDSNWKVGHRANASGCLVQPLLWICNILPMLHEGDIVRIGYNSEDQAVKYQTELKNLWNAATAIQNNKNVKLEFPLITLTKAQVLERVFTEYDYLIEYITSCEGFYMKDKPCGRCVPCNNLKKALLTVGLLENKKASKIALQMLLERFNIEAIPE